MARSLIETFFDKKKIGKIDNDLELSDIQNEGGVGENNNINNVNEIDIIPNSINLIFISSLHNSSFKTEFLKGIVFILGKGNLSRLSPNFLCLNKNLLFVNISSLISNFGLFSLFLVIYYS